MNNHFFIKSLHQAPRRELTVAEEMELEALPERIKVLFNMRVKALIDEIEHRQEQKLFVPHAPVAPTQRFNEEMPPPM